MVTKRLFMSSVFILLIVVLFQIVNVSADCAGGSDQRIMVLSAADNAHVEIATAGYYSSGAFVCYDALWGKSYPTTTNTHACNPPTAPTNKVIGFSASSPAGSNAHAESPTIAQSTGYTYLCFGDLVCSLKSSCSGTEKTVVLLNASANSHLGISGGSSYTNKLCCSSAYADTPTGQAPSPPGTPVLTNISSCSSAINVSWAASTGTEPITYNIYRWTTGSPAIVGTVTSPQTSFLDMTVSVSTTYNYKIGATNAYGAANSSSASKTTPAACAGPPNAPTNFVVSNHTCDKNLTVTWSYSGGPVPTSYKVYRWTAGSPTPTVVATPSYPTMTFVDSSVVAGILYYYNVSAVGTAGESAQTGPRSAVSTLLTAPAKPTLSTTGASCGGSVRLSWSSSTCDIAYNVTRSDSPIGPFVNTAWLNGLIYYPTLTTNDYPGASVIKYYRVAAINPAGSTYSDAVSGTGSSNCPTCTDDCSPSGLRECVGNGWHQCGNYDADSCLEWSSVTTCIGTCSGGACVPTGENGVCSTVSNYTCVSGTKSPLRQNSTHYIWDCLAIPPATVNAYNCTYSKIIVSNDYAPTIQLGGRSPNNGQSISAELGGLGIVNITATVTDYSDVGTITPINGCILHLDGNNYSMNFVETFNDLSGNAGYCNYYNSSVAVGQHSYYVSVNDTANYINSTDLRLFNITSHSTIPDFLIASWQDLLGMEIDTTSAELCLGNTVNLVARTDLASGTEIVFGLRSGGTTIRTFYANVSGGGFASASWMISDADIVAAGNLPSNNFYFNVSGGGLFNESKILRVTNDDTCLEGMIPQVYVPFFGWAQFTVSLIAIFAIYAVVVFVFKKRKK